MVQSDDDGAAEAGTPPDVVVIGAKQDDASTPSGSDGASGQEGGSEPPIDGGVKPKDAAVVDASPSQTNGGKRPDAGADPSEPDARTPAEPMDAGASDTSVPPPVVDAAAPVVPPDAALPLVPDAGRTGCLPGTYKGSFEGEISALLGLVRIDVAGDITIEVDLEQAGGDRLKVKTGILQGTDTSDQKNPLFARIGGTLNCATKKLENGTITDGTYNRVDPLYPWQPPTTTTFSGTISGVYSTSPPAAVGTWMVTNDTGTRTSMGTWNAALE
jgi:hypothetical protein